MAHEVFDLGFGDGGLVRTHGAGGGTDVHPDRWGSMNHGPKWNIPGEYMAHQWLSLAGGFGGEGE